MILKKARIKFQKFKEHGGIRKGIEQIKSLPIWLSLISVILIIYDFGFDQSESVQIILYRFYLLTLIAGSISIISRYFFIKKLPSLRVWPFDLLIIAIIFGLIYRSYNDLFSIYREWLYAIVFILFIREFSSLKLDLKKKYLNPAQLFIISFIGIIAIGTVLLKLPNATHSGITTVDALFTSTSAVCVTGLIVVDTGSYFTLFGQMVLLILIQLGGLGIMTFTSYFSYFFSGGSTYETQLMLKDITSSEKIADVFKTLKKIILLTFLVESIGAILIFTNLDATVIPSISDRTFFAVFHTVSGYCNAGFSTLKNSLYEPAFRFNYPLHLIIATLFIIGGIGFPIMFNFYKYIKHLILNKLFYWVSDKPKTYVPWVININTRIVLITSAILVVSGTVLFYLFEYNNTLEEHKGYGKLVTAFFGAVTPRTAGFNSIDTSAMYFSTTMIIFLLMWIGASPASTGGGIKTSTIAIGTLNFLSIARGKNRIELFNREISNDSVRRAFAIISLSLVIIGGAVFFISWFDSDKDLLPIAFECFSAYSTVGLSLGITSELSEASKIIIIGTMFIGRVSMLTILIALLRKVKHFKYKYPTEEILIN